MKFPDLEGDFSNHLGLFVNKFVDKPLRRCKFDLERVLEFDSFPNSRIFHIGFRTQSNHFFIN